MLTGEESTVISKGNINNDVKHGALSGARSALSGLKFYNR
jgi:hypothetical protein